LPSSSDRISNPVNSFNLLPKRLVSTTVDIPQDLKIPSPTNAAPSSDSISEFTSSSLDSITPESYSPIISEHLGFLKQLGLDYGWGPTALVETVLESVHIATGTPWWASIMLTTLLLRVAFLKLHINAADTSARLATLMPHIAPLKERINASKLTNDMDALKLASAEMKQVYTAANIEVWRIFLPFLVQIPLGFATFRLLRGMATLPVPGLDEGGLWWLKDLTLSDPYFVLPMAVGATFYWTIKV
jgi:YidC/Oxa1 family membrane protein insertase